MAEPLNVDTARLRDAADNLRALTFPEPPARITTTGGDSLSAAVNETMNVIESPVLDDLPVAEAALAKTASSIAAAATMYADTDQSLGSALAHHEFSSAGPGPGGAPTTTSRATAPTDAVAPVRPPDYLTTVGSALGSVNEVVQPVNQIANSTSTFTQSMVQSAQRAAQNQPAGEQPRDEADDAGADRQDDDAVDGLAPIEHVENVPLQTLSDTSSGRHRAQSIVAPVPGSSAQTAFEP